MDVWFDSGVTWRAVVEKRSDELGHTPVDMYLEGSDQHRGWFQSSLLTSMAVQGKAPYKSVLTHGFVFGEDGRKMSKSLGNYIRPDDIIKNYGADILRLWAASVDYRNDTKIGDNIIKQLAEIFKKTRNTARFLLGNIFDFNPQKDYVKSGDADVLKANAKELADIFITSQAYVSDSAPEGVLNEYTENGITVWVVNAEGEKCERCWKYRKLGEHAGHETICSDCYCAVVE